MRSLPQTYSQDQIPLSPQVRLPVVIRELRHIQYRKRLPTQPIRSPHTDLETAVRLTVVFHTMARVVYPGSFDLVTNGHLDIIRRAAAVYDQVVVSVVVNINKKGRFTIEERVDMLREVTADLNNVCVDSSQGLLVDYWQREKFAMVVRGLRTVSDFEGELRMAQMNYGLAGVETVFMMMNQKYNFSSSLVKEIVDLGGDVSHLIPPTVLNRMKRNVAS